MEEMQFKDTKDSTGNTIGIIDYIIILNKNKKLILLTTLFITIVSIILFFFVADLIYYSEARVKSSSKGSMGLMGLEGLPDIGLDLAGGGKTVKELALYEEILSSRRCLEPLIIKFGLFERDEYDFMEDAIKMFVKEKLKIEVDKIAGVMSIGVYDKDKQLAKEMVEYLLEQLNTINIEINVQNAKANREFIENRYLLAREDLSKSEDSLKSFQLIYGVAPDLQIKAAAQSVFTLEAELKAEEVKLDVIRKILSADQPEVKLQEAKVNSLRDKISGIQTSTDLSDFLRLGNSPQIAQQYLRLQREIEIQTKILTFILPLYEQAKIEEKRETPTVIVLEKPYLADRKSKPKRLTMVVFSAFLSFILISLGVLTYNLYIKKAVVLIKSRK